MKLRRQVIGTATAGAMLCLPLAANAAADIYGKIHLSADYMDTGATEGHALSNNASRIGLKGKEQITDSVKAFFKIEFETTFEESTIDGKDTIFKARDHYFGFESKSGNLQFGYYDTPAKLLGKKFEQFGDTIGDRRGILGYDYQRGKKFDIRDDDAVMYSSPSIAGLIVRLMRSAGSTSSDIADGADNSPVTSMSALYDTKKYYFGVAYEDQEKIKVSALRFVGGVAFASVKLNAIFEQLSSDAQPGSDRSAYGISGSYGLGAYTLKAQAMVADDLADESDTGAYAISAALFKKLSKTLEIYGMASRLENGDNAEYRLTGSGHGNDYKPSGAGANMHSVSAGLIYKF